MSQTYRITRVSTPDGYERRMLLVIVIPQHSLRLVGVKRDRWSRSLEVAIDRVADYSGCDPRQVVVQNDVAEY